MKGLNKLALATAVAAAPFATQAMEPMSDSQMGNVTGQQGVTIELNTAMTIDQIEYSQDTNGSVLVDDIRVGGFDDGSTLDLYVDIDLQDSGDAVISLGSLDGGPVELGVDAGVEFDGDGDSSDTQALGLDGDAGSATLISGFEMNMYLTQLDITAQVAELDGTVPSDSTGSLAIEAGFAIDALDVNFDVAAVSLEGMRMAGDGSLALLKDDSTIGTGQIAGAPAVASMTIGAGDALGADAQPNGGDVLRINIDQFQADMWMPTINVGGATIGSVAIDNLQVQQTDIAVYGRP